MRVNPDSMEMHAIGKAISKNQSLSLGSKNVFLLSEWTKCGKQMEIEFCLYIQKFVVLCCMDIPVQDCVSKALISKCTID